MSNTGKLTLDEFFGHLSAAIRLLKASPGVPPVSKNPQAMWFKVPDSNFCYCPIALVRRHLGEVRGTTPQNDQATVWDRLDCQQRNAILCAADNTRRGKLAFGDQLTSYARKRLRDLRRRARRFAPQA